MSQINSSNIKFSELKSFLSLNTKTTVNFSDLKNLTSDNVKADSYSLSIFANKIKTYLPNENVLYEPILWYDANLPQQNTSLNKYKILLQNLTINKYAFNGKPSFEFFNQSNYIKDDTDYISSDSFSFIFALYSINKNAKISDLFFNNIDQSFVSLFNLLYNYYKDKTYNITIPCIVIIYINIIPQNKLQIITKINGIVYDGYINYDGNNILFNKYCILLNNFNGFISEILIYNKDIFNKIEFIESYLSSKWFGIPSYCLPSTHKFYNVPALNIDKSPNIYYNCFNYNNYGIDGNLYNLLLTVDYKSKVEYYYSSSTDINILCWFKFDNSANNAISNNYNLTLISFKAPSFEYSTECIKGTASLNLNTNNGTISIPTILKQENILEFTLIFWFYLNESINILTSGSCRFITINYNGGITQFIITNFFNNLVIQYNTQTFIISNNAFTKINQWQNIALSMKKYGVNSMILDIYYNSDLIKSNIIIENFSLINSLTNEIIINEIKNNILYDDFRFYKKALAKNEIQYILQYPITIQNGTSSIPNTYGYKWNLSKFTSGNLLQVANYIDIGNIKNRNITINFNFTFIIENFNIINIIYISQFLEISIIKEGGQYLIKFIYKIINDSNNSFIIVIKKFILNNFIINKNHNFFIILNFNASAENNIIIYLNNSDPLSEALNAESIPSYFNIDNVFYIGNFYQTISTIDVSSITTSPFQIENLQIYISENQTKPNYSSLPIYSYYNYDKYNIRYPFTLCKFNFFNSINTHLGIDNYTDIVKNYYKENNLIYNWIDNNNFLSFYNGLYKLLIPTSGYYNFIIAGGAGGFSSKNKLISGYGIISVINIYLEVDTVLYIGTGSKGGDVINKITLFDNGESMGEFDMCGGGGGLSFIYNFTNSSLIAIAGGGGGNGINFNGTNASLTTSGSKNSLNLSYSSEANNGAGGNNGVFFNSGYGGGGGGFNSDGLLTEFSGLSLKKIINNNLKINIPQQEHGGFGGFPCGATGGINGYLNVWGGGGGGGYSGGMGGSATINSYVAGGGGGGSYDINGINNSITLINSEGINGYNSNNGYVAINFLTKNTFLSYSKAKITITDGLTLLHEINNKVCFDYIKINNYLINQVDGISSQIIGRFNIDDTIPNTYNYLRFAYDITNSGNLLINNFKVQLKCICLYYTLISSEKTNTFISNISTTYTYFFNNNNYPNINDIINDTTPLNFITILFENDITDKIITLFKDLSIEIMVIIGYNRKISFNEHLINYNKYKS